MRGTVTRKRDRWYICYYIGKDANGKWKQKWEGSWDTKREAERVLRLRMDELDNTFERKADKSTMAVFLRHWLQVYCEPRLASNTVRGYRVNVENHIIPGIGNILLSRLQPKDIQALYASLLKKGLSGTSVRYVHNNLHKALGYAVRHEMISRNPADLVDIPKCERYEAQTLTPEQVLTLLKASHAQGIYLPVMLAVTLGLRRGEVLGLQWDDVNLSAGQLTVRHSASFNKGGFTLSTPKTQNSRRTLLLPEKLCEALESARLKQCDMARLAGACYNPYGLVCCRADGAPLSSNALNHRFRAAVENSNLPPIRFHDLRHTHATLMLRHAVPAKIVSAMLGHSSIGITMDTYSHVMTDMQEGAVGIMDSLLTAY